MKKLFFNIVCAYLIIVLIIFTYLFNVKVMATKLYDVVLIDTLIEERPKAPDTMLYFHTLQRLPISNTQDIRLKYSRLVNNNEFKSTTGQIQSIFETDKKNIYKLSVKDSINKIIRDKKNVFSVSLMIREEKPIYVMIFQRIINPFVH